MVGGPGEIVGHIQSILGSIVVGIVENGKEDEFDGRERGIVVPQEEWRCWIHNINLYEEDINGP